MQEVGAALPPKELNVRVQINQDVRLGDKAKPYQLAGYPMAFSQSEGCPDLGSYCVSILLGPFEKGKRAGEATLYTLRNTPLGVPTKPRGLMVVVSAPLSRWTEIAAPRAPSLSLVVQIRPGRGEVTPVPGEQGPPASQSNPGDEDVPVPHLASLVLGEIAPHASCRLGVVPGEPDDRYASQQPPHLGPVRLGLGPAPELVECHDRQA